MENSFTLTEEDKIFWFSFIETKVGLILPEIQQNHFVSKIIEKMRSYNLSSSEYFKKVNQSNSEWQALINELTIPETSFFRHPASYDLVKTYFENMKNKTIHSWSVGCSTGEEAWSIAMMCDRVTNSFRVLATDVNEISLQKAKFAVYDKRRLMGLPNGYLDTYFNTDINQNSKYVIKDSLKSHVSFYKFNLIEQNKIPFKELDLIYCQNVLIYFRGFVQRDILNRLVDSLSIGGLLVLAPAEARSWKHMDMERVHYPGTLAFKKIK